MPSDQSDGEIDRRRQVECHNCEEFEMSKSYRGAAETLGKDEFDEIDLPDECPVCEADLVITMTDGGQPADEIDRTCGVHHCAADPCVLHRTDAQVRYCDDTTPIEDPQCCGWTMDKTALAAGGDLDHVRHRYECRGCGDLAVVRERKPQRSLAEFGEPLTDGGRIQDGDGVAHDDGTTYVLEEVDDDE